MTNYYIRKLVTNFDFNVGDNGYSDTNLLEDYDEPLLGDFYREAVRTKPLSVLITDTQEFFWIDSTGDREGSVSIASITAANIHKEVSSNGYFYWSVYNDTPARQMGYISSSWQADGWGSPDSQYATFLGNLCSKFNSLRAITEESNGDNWNLYLFQYNYSDSPQPSYGDHIYFPIFTKGNDPNYDSIITI